MLSKRESGGRLLPAGVLGVRGAFASGQAVRVAIRRKQTPVDAVDKLEAEKVAAKARETYLQGGETQPGTPVLPANDSLTSSISTIDGLLGNPVANLGDEEVTPSAHSRALPDDDHVLLNNGKDESEDWELEEVGRGLANYNSAQIARVKGLKRLVFRLRSVASLSDHPVLSL